MCGIPMRPEVVPDALNGRKLSFEQAVAHVGGVDNLVTEAGRALIHANAKQYLWKYPDKLTHCTACGRSVEGFYGHHGQRYACPRCGAMAEFRYAAKGHMKIYDSFYLYEWRRSIIDPEAVALVGVYCERDSTKPEPHRAQIRTTPTALYIFRPGKAATVYKKRWHFGRDGYVLEWETVNSVHPEHSRWGNAPLDIVIDQAQFRAVLEGTKIGRLYTLLRSETKRWEDLELDAIANCARRPWLEYLYKAGQRYLAGQLMREATIPKDSGIHQRAKTPRELLGLTEGQWYEARRDGVCLTLDALRTLKAMARLDIGPVKLADAMRLAAGTDAAWHITRDLLPQKEGVGICQRLAKLLDRARRKIMRHILKDLRHSHDWRDYYGQLAELRQIPMDGDAFAEADMALLMPKDMPAMHRRMTERLNAIDREKRLAELAQRQAKLEARLKAGLRKDYTFQAAGLILRPYESIAEVIDEGAALHICIGSYAGRYAEGGTIICCLRQANEPDVPWRAVEFTSSGKMVQDRGMYNDGKGIPPGTRAQLRTFWNAWDKAHEKGRKSA